MKYRITILLASILALFSCSDEKEQMKWVDLRYRVEDSYLLEASNPETISFLVKSTDPWMVYGTADWYTITPPSGEGDMENTTTVTIVCEENTDLDDRTDTVKIQTDYWIGKEFTITQKGIAYLEYEPVLNIPQVEWGDGWPYFADGEPTEGKVSGPTWKNPDVKSFAVRVVDNDGAGPLVETGDPCGCRNTWSFSELNNNTYEIKLYE